MLREYMPRFARRDHEARFGGIAEIVEAAKAGGMRARERMIGFRVEALAAIERIKAAARGKREIAETVEQRHMAVELMRQQRDMFARPSAIGSCRRRRAA